MLVDQMNLIREIVGTGVAAYIVVMAFIFFSRLASAR